MSRLTLVAIIAITLVAVALTVAPIFETVAVELAALTDILAGLI